jgi:hypothetical protein
MSFTFLVVDERRIGPEATSPGAIRALIGRHGADWGRAEASEADLVTVFRVLDGFARTKTLLATLATRGSPRHVLLASMEPWRLGWFEAGLVPPLHAVLRGSGPRIARTMAGLGDSAELLSYRFTSTLEEARLRGAAVAILHPAPQRA